MPRLSPIPYEDQGAEPEAAVRAHVEGMKVKDACARYGVSKAQFNAALDRAARGRVDPAQRLRDIFVMAERLEAAMVAIMPHAQRGDSEAINAMCRVSERLSALLGLAARRDDLAQLAAAVEPAGSSTERLRMTIEALRAEDKQRIRNGGEGYGDWRDAMDREELARRIVEGPPQPEGDESAYFPIERQLGDE